MRVPELFALRDKREHARVNRELAALVRARSSRHARIRLHEGSFPSYYLADENIWFIAHALPNRYRNAFGPGDPVGRRNLWPSVQLNLALSPGSSRPHARFLRDARDQFWVAHTGALGGRQAGISREGFLGLLGGGHRVRVDGIDETLYVLGTFADPSPLVGQIMKLTHAADAYREALAAGLVHQATVASMKPTKADAKRPRIYGMSFASVYPLYVQKAEKKGRTRAEVDQAIKWLTGYTAVQLKKAIDTKIDFETFFAKAKLHKNAPLITGVVCGVRIEDLDDPLMKKIRYLDKLVDELAKGRPMAKILRAG